MARLPQGAQLKAASLAARQGERPLAPRAVQQAQQGERDESGPAEPEPGRQAWPLVRERTAALALGLSALLGPRQELWLRALEALRPVQLALRVRLARLALRLCARQERVAEELEEEAPRTACEQLWRLLPWLPFRPWRPLPPELQLLPAPEFSCELFPRRRREWSSSASFSP